MSGPTTFHREKMVRTRNRKGERHAHTRPLTDPVWIDAGAATHMRPDDPVLGLLEGGVPRALPWWIMKNHHVANLLLDGRPILVTLCEACSSAAAFLSRVNGRQHTFRQDATYNGTILLIDYETGTFWAPFTGEALDGPLRGSRLARLPLYQCTWGEWRELYPDGLVPDGQGESRHGHGSDQWPGKPGMLGGGRTLVHADTRLPHSELVLGVEAHGVARAYPLAALHLMGSALNDVLGGQEIVIFSRRHSLMAVAFSRWVDGECLEFEAGVDGTIVDRTTRSRWNLAGRAIAGPLLGRVLSFVPSGVEEWLVWAAYHPNAEIFAAGRPIQHPRGRRAWREERYAFAGPSAWCSPDPPQALIGLLEGGFAPKRLLDLGCGSGAIALSLARQGLRVVGIDFSLNAVRSARLLSQGDAPLSGLVVGDALHLPFKPGAFDGVYDRGCFHSISLWRRSEYCRELARVLAPGGYFVLQTLSDRDWRARPLLTRLRRTLSTMLGRAGTFITDAGIRRLFGRRFAIRRIQEIELVTQDGERPRLKEVTLQHKEEGKPRPLSAS
jgi:SAM-dependent methyltransferase